MITRYQPRTQVERWQLQDRLVLRLRQIGCARLPRFYEASGGRLAFRVRLGWRPHPGVLERLAGIDEPAPSAG